MTTHVLTIGPRRVHMTVHEEPTEIVCDLTSTILLKGEVWQACGGWQVSLLGGFYQMQVKGASTEKFLTFARAACVALIRAARRLEKES